MSVPQLNRRLTLEAPERVADGAGGFVEIWVPLGTLWAEIQPRTGRVTSGEVGSVSVAAFRIVVRAAVHGSTARPVAGQRFAMGPRRFLIESVTEVEPRALYLVCDAEEEVAA